MIKAGVYGVRNEATAALIKILLFHPDVNLAWVYDGERSSRLDHLYPYLTGDTDLSTVDELPERFDDVDVVLLLKALDSDNLNVLLQNATVKVIDLTGKYNLDEEVTYGLAEINRKIIVHDCYRVAVPDAVAHAVELALLPLAKNLMITSDVEVSEQGMSFDAEVAKSEVCRLLKGIQSSFVYDVNITAASHETSSKGIVVKATLACRTDIEVLRQVYENYFDDHNFTYIVDFVPQAADVIRTNKCLLHLERIDDKLVVTAAIDGLLKGCAGNAVHNLNLLFGLHERVGLETF